MANMMYHGIRLTKLDVSEGDILLLRPDARNLNPEAFRRTGMLSAALNHPVVLLDKLSIHCDEVWISGCSTGYKPQNEDLLIAHRDERRRVSNCLACHRAHTPESGYRDVLSHRAKHNYLPRPTHAKHTEVFEVPLWMLAPYSRDRPVNFYQLDDSSLELLKKKAKAATNQLERHSAALKMWPRLLPTCGTNSGSESDGSTTQSYDPGSEFSVQDERRKTPSTKAKPQDSASPTASLASSLELTEAHPPVITRLKKNPHRQRRKTKTTVQQPAPPEQEEAESVHDSDNMSTQQPAGQSNLPSPATEISMNPPPVPPRKVVFLSLAAEVPLGSIFEIDPSAYSELVESINGTDRRFDFFEDISVRYVYAGASESLPGHADVFEINESNWQEDSDGEADLDGQEDTSDLAICLRMKHPDDGQVPHEYLRLNESRYLPGHGEGPCGRFWLTVEMPIQRLDVRCLKTLDEKDVGYYRLTNISLEFALERRARLERLAKVAALLSARGGG